MCCWGEPGHINNKMGWSPWNYCVLFLYHLPGLPCKPHAGTCKQTLMFTYIRTLHNHISPSHQLSNKCDIRMRRACKVCANYLLLCCKLFENLALKTSTYYPIVWGSGNWCVVSWELLAQNVSQVFNQVVICGIMISKLHEGGFASTLTYKAVGRSQVPTGLCQCQLLPQGFPSSSEGEGSSKMEAS